MCCGEWIAYRIFCTRTAHRNVNHSELRTLHCLQIACARPKLQHKDTHT